MLKAEPQSQIHFASMIGVNVDLDILPHWISHYLKMDFDSYTVFLHTSGKKGKDEEAVRLLKNGSFKITTLPPEIVADNFIDPGEPGIGVRYFVLDGFALTIPTRDFIVTADGDEFQEWSMTPREFVERGTKIVVGYHLDRFDDTLHEIDSSKTLDENYPQSHRNLSMLWRADNPYNTRKVVLCPARYPLDYSGSHEVKKEYILKAPNPLASDGVIVHHFRWRRTMFERVKNRPNWDQKGIDFLKHFFAWEEG